MTQHHLGLTEAQQRQMLTEGSLQAVGSGLLLYGGVRSFLRGRAPAAPTGQQRCFPNCFPTGTLIATEHGLRPIETIQASDRVWAFDLIAGKWRLCFVVETYAYEHDGDLVTLTVADEAIEATGKHPFWVVEGQGLERRPRAEHVPETPWGAKIPGRWVDAGDLQVGDVLLLRSGRPVAVTRLAVRHVRQQVYNFQVEELHCYAVGVSQVLVHNNCGEGAPTLPEYTPDQRALQQLVNEATLGGRRPLTASDAQIVMQWAREINYPGFRAGAADLASPSNWVANPVPHIHLPGVGRGGHVPVVPGIIP
jgi:hypothetical protein